MPLEKETEYLLKTKLHNSTRTSQQIIYIITDAQGFVNTFLIFMTKESTFKRRKIGSLTN